jgi:hypothetical protein
MRIDFDSTTLEHLGSELELTHCTLHQLAEYLRAKSALPERLEKRKHALHVALGPLLRPRAVLRRPCIRARRRRPAGDGVDGQRWAVPGEATYCASSRRCCQRAHERAPSDHRRGSDSRAPGAQEITGAEAGETPGGT